MENHITIRYKESLYCSRKVSQNLYSLLYHYILYYLWEHQFKLLPSIAWCNLPSTYVAFGIFYLAYYMSTIWRNCPQYWSINKFASFNSFSLLELDTFEARTLSEPADGVSSRPCNPWSLLCIDIYECY